MLEALKKAFDKKEKTPMPEDGRTLHKILNDDNQSPHFGKFLETKGDAGKELAERIANKDIKPEDIPLLNELRAEHNERMKHVGELEKGMSAEEIVMFAKNHPELEEVINLLGPEKAAKMMKSELYSLLEDDYDSFKDLYDQHNQIDAFKKGKLKDLDETILKQCEGMGLSEKDFKKLMNSDDRKETLKELRQEIKNSYGGFKRALDWFGGGFSRSDARKLERRAKDADAAFEEMDGLREDVGGVLSMLVQNNPDVMKAFNREMADDPETPKEQRVAYSEIKRSLPPSEDELNAEWETFKTTEKLNVGDFEKKSTNDQADILKRFKQLLDQKQETKLPAKKVGFWKSIFGGVFGSFFDNKKNDLK